MKTEILLHNIEYWYNDNEGMELTESDREHIHYMITQGYREGELITTDESTENEIYGYWKINFNRN